MARVLTEVTVTVGTSEEEELKEYCDVEEDVAWEEPKAQTASTNNRDIIDMDGVSMKSIQNEPEQLNLASSFEKQKKLLKKEDKWYTLEPQKNAAACAYRRFF